MVCFRACREKISEMGFAPWYAGRLSGLVGRGVREEKGIAVQDSRAWQRTSSPEEACTAGGMVRVFSGSQMPRVGLLDNDIEISSAVLGSYMQY